MAEAAEPANLEAEKESLMLTLHVEESDYEK